MKNQMKKIQIDMSNISSDEAAQTVTQKIKEMIEKHYPFRILNMTRPYHGGILNAKVLGKRKEKLFSKGDQRILALKKKSH